jgi:chromosome segregation protein
VSQGRIGAVINAKPSDRRGLLEEAAGITGLHSRRHEAELRLRAAETNLERLDDVIATLEAQLQGLKKQARQANRYRRLADRIRRNEAMVLHLEGAAAEQARSLAGERLAASEAAVVALTASTAACASEQAAAVAELPDLRQAEAAAAAAVQRLLVDRDNLDREEAQVAAARAQAEQRLSQTDGDRARAQAQAEDAADARKRLDQERGDLEAAAEGEAAVLEGADGARAEAEATVRQDESAVAELTQAIAGDEARSTALQRRIAELAERLKRLTDRAAELAALGDRQAAERVGEAAVGAAKQAVERAEADLQRIRAEVEAADAKQAEARAQATATRDRLQAAEARHGKLEAEIAALSALLEAGDGELWPPLVDAVAVEPGYETALGAALGDDLTASADGAAPVHWQPLPPYQTPSPLPEGATPLSRFVRGPEVLTRRLGQIGVVADPEAGRRAQDELRPGQRLVTRDGALWRWDGYTAAADAPTGAAQRLAQRNRLQDLRPRLAEAAGTLEGLRAEHDAAQDGAERAAERVRELRGGLDDAFAALNDARQGQARLTQGAVAAESRLAATLEAGQEVAAERTECEAALTEAEAARESMPELSGARAELGELRARLAENHGALAERRSAVERLVREAEARARRLTAIAQERESWTRRAEEAGRYLTELGTRRSEVEAEIESLAARPLEIAERRETLAELVETAEAGRRQTADALAEGETRLAQADRALKAEEQKLAEAREDRVRGEAAVAQGEQALEVLRERVRERLDCTLDRVLEIAEIDPSQELPPREEVETKLARLLRERDNMGPVNLRAEQEAEDLEQQITGLGSERSDLVSAIARLRQGIASLNKEGRERLLAAFEAVNSHFTELFVRLFGGGRAHLTLGEAEDPLDAGLEIMASPPGKRLQVMSLLSGGEQALTALALLFAVFLTNPAPICVLDEVDAPLDDANVERFCALVEELARGTATRFFIITHHRITMARMDRLYGVTMAERGISQLVSVDLSAAEELRESA